MSRQTPSFGRFLLREWALTALVCAALCAGVYCLWTGKAPAQMVSAWHDAMRAAGAPMASEPGRAASAAKTEKKGAEKASRPVEEIHGGQKQ
jgi:hypothetical protein